MSRYVLISSRDPFTCATTSDFYELAGAFKREGHEVVLFLVENGVFPARAAADCEALGDVVRAGVTVLADAFALRERAIASTTLREGIDAAPLDRVIDELAARSRVIWH